MQNTDYKLLYSPYSPRVINGVKDKHRGFDISNNDIGGQPLVAPFDGTVQNVGFTDDCGYYICITYGKEGESKEDPVTGKNLIVIYQHMSDESEFDRGDEVTKEQIVGHVGSTGTSAAHLHMEVNNLNAGIGNAGRSNFTNTINPVYFYRDVSFNLNNLCYAAKNGYGFYWYNYNHNDPNKD